MIDYSGPVAQWWSLCYTGLVLEYVNIPNIDDRVLNRAVKLLQDGGLVAWPSDSSWAISCALDSKKGLEGLKRLKGPRDFTPTVVCRSMSQFTELAVFRNPHYKVVKDLVPGPYVFILPATHAIHRHMAMKRSELGLRIPGHPVPLALVEALGKPVFSITASRHMAEEGWWSQEFAEENLFDYGAELEGIPGVDLIIDSGEVLPRSLTTVISLMDDEPLVLRPGIGPF